jgi:IclR family transcriptional regulator, pca regulon regulatory protein
MPRTRAGTAKAAGGKETNGQDPAWSIPSLREPRYSQSLERGLAILGCFTPKRPVLGIADIADDLGMSRSTTHRYVITLVALGYLEQGASRKYRLGLRVTDLGMAALNSTGLREHAHPYLEELRQRSTYTTSLGVLDGSDVLYVDRVRSFRRGQSADPNLHTGSRLPAYCTAAGKLLLANLPEPEQKDLLASMKLAKRAPNTITSKKALREELEQIQSAGFAVNDQEMARELQGIAAPVRNEAREVVAAVNLAAPSSVISLEELVDALGPHLVSTADRISARLGYRRDDEQS